MPVIQEIRNEILPEIIALPTAPLYEDLIVGYVKTMAGKLGLPVTEDSYGNLIVEYRQAKDVPAIGLVAHMDHPAFEIESVKDKQTTMAFRGGAACPAKKDRLLFYQNAKADPIPITVEDVVYSDGKPTHLLVEGIKLPTPKGFAVYDIVPFRQDGSKLIGRALDDLAGCAALIALLELLTQKRPDAHVYAIFTRAEEIGFIGACGLAMSNVLPNNMPMISLEASKMLPGAEQGHGVVVRLGDKKSLFHARITNFLMEVAQEAVTESPGFCFQKQLLDGGTCEASLFNAFGYQASGLAVPLGCYHNNGSDGKVAAEHIHWQDWLNMVVLIWHAATKSQRLEQQETSNRSYFLTRFEKYQQRILQL